MENKHYQIINKLHTDGAGEVLINTFINQYKRYFSESDRRVHQADNLIYEKDIESVKELPDSVELQTEINAGLESLSNTVVFKLNGGLGTSMGLSKAKSLLPVKDNLSFLDIIIKQIINLRNSTDCRLPLILMNSFSTDSDTKALLSNYPDLINSQKHLALSFLQNRVPKIRANDHLPVSYPASPELEWCPPGHGDFYTSLLTNGLLDKLLAAGYEYAFISNSDNLGATLDLKILGYFANNNYPVLMEVADRTKADRKGGHLAKAKDGCLLLRESAQCPVDELNEFQNIIKHRYFNTNNLWINLKHLSEKINDNQGILPLSLIINKKTVDPRDHESTPVYQLETAIGSVINLFPAAQAIRVPRARFAPVKTTNDLLLVMSDHYILNQDMSLTRNPNRGYHNCLIDLDRKYFGKLDNFNARFPHGSPSLIKCNSLKVTGDYLFGSNITFEGDVTLINNSQEQKYIPSNTTLKL